MRHGYALCVLFVGPFCLTLPRNETLTAGGNSCVLILCTMWETEEIEFPLFFQVPGDISANKGVLMHQSDLLIMFCLCF